VTSKRYLISFGSNDMFAMGIPSKAGVEYHQPVKVEEVDGGFSSDDFEHIACTSVSTVCLSKTGLVYTMGTENNGILGRLSTEMYPEDDEWAVEREGATLSRVTGFTGGSGPEERIVALSTGDCHTLALSETGKLYFWGSLKDGNRQFFFDGNKWCLRGVNETPVHIPLQKRVGVISSGFNFAGLLFEDGAMASFGFGTEGELGRPGTMKIPCPTEFDSNAYLLPYITLDEANPVDMAVLGNYTTPGNVSIPRVFRSRKTMTIACGQHHWFALMGTKTGTELYAIGSNGSGQLGLGGNTDWPDNNPDFGPTRVNLTLVEFFKDNNITIVDLAAGLDFSLVLDDEGHIYSFGGGTRGQLGHEGFGEKGQPMRIAIPRQVQFPRQVKITKIAVGESTCMAWSEAGELWTFGNGATGHKMATLKADPVNVPTVLDIGVAFGGNDRIVRIHEMAGGASHGCLLVDVVEASSEEARPHP
jgi:regulator of chromosome condensation